MREYSLERFYQQYPQQSTELSAGKSFVYRYYKNPKAKATVVLLTGGMGLSDLFYLHFERFAEQFSVLTFDYQIPFQTHRAFAQAVGELLCELNEKVWLVGQSLGGIVAQILAVEFPERIEGMALSNTCALAEDMGEEAYQYLMNMLKSQEKFKKLLSFIPFSLFKKMMKRTVMKKKTGGFTTEEKQRMEDLCDAMTRLLTRSYETHMIDFLLDSQNYFHMTPEAFQKWDDKVLLILSEDDHTFNQACKDALIHLMPHPTVVTDITGGHLALMVKLETYAAAICRYITQRTP